MYITRCAISVIAVGLLVVPPAYADDYSMLNDPWRIYIGAFDSTADSKIGINGDILPPVPPILVEDVLGVEEGKTVAWGGIRWRFASRHAVEMEIFDLGRTGTRSGDFSPPLEIGDSIIEAGQVDTEYDTNIVRLTYAWSAFRNDRSDFQIKAGLHILTMKANINLVGAICTPNTVPSVPPGCPPAGTGTENEDVSAPLPHFGLQYGYAMTPNSAFRVSAVGFAVELDKIDGSLIEVDADVAWQPWRHVGFGVGYRYFNGDVKSTGSELNGSFRFEYQGPQIYVEATF